MPSVGEVAALGIASAGAGEDHLSSVETSRESRAITGLPDALSTSGPLAEKHPASASGLAPSQGFSLGHGFPIIPAKMVNKLQKWEFVNMSELLPDNLELARRSADSRVATSCATVKSPKKRELSEDWRGLIAWSVCLCGNHCQEVPDQVSGAASLPLYHSRRGVTIWV